MNAKKLLNKPLTSTSFSIPASKFQHIPSIKLASFNVAGIRASLQKGFTHWLDKEDPDILLLQETKLSSTCQWPNQLYQHQYFSHANRRKGYSGTAVLSRVPPLAVEYPKLGHDLLDGEGRQLCVEFDDYFVLNTYIPFSGVQLEKLDLKTKYFESIQEYLSKLKKPIIWGGDINVALGSIDVHPTLYHEGIAGCTMQERKAFEGIAQDLKLVDSFRHFHPHEQAYSYFSYSKNSYNRKVGWRLDYWMVSKDLVDEQLILDSEIRQSCYGASDHVPIILTIKKDKS